MKNKYDAIDYREFGLPSMEVYGDQFHYQDIYELIGKDQLMSTFVLKEGSESHNEYGRLATGVVYYDKKSLNELEAASSSKAVVEKARIRIDAPGDELSDDKRGDLKYRGVKIDDIERISYLMYKKEIERHETGEKIVPNVIEIKMDCEGLDVDILSQNYLVLKHNSGTSLIQYEKEQLVGITLALNNGRIDARILSSLGFCQDDIKSNLNIWMNIYKVKERRNLLTEFDKRNYSEIKDIFFLENSIALIKEMASAGLTNSLKDADRIIIRDIFSAVKEFSPSILMHGKNQVYWDKKSYIHIATRHLKEYQVGHFVSKTPFPYKSEDLKLLIEKVLGSIKIEIEKYLLSNSERDFTRHGKMAVTFNGDHYHIRIDPSGRLAQFHIVD